MTDDERRTRQPLSMTRRYRRGLILTGLLCALAVLTAATVLFQRSYAERIDNYLMQICHGYAAAYEAQDTHSATTLLNLLPENLPLRITLIDTDGTVLYDTKRGSYIVDVNGDIYAAQTDLPNHADRPEFQQAMASGSACITRESETLQLETHYYAVRIDLIASNPVDKVDRPKPQAFMASYYSAEEMEKLFEVAQGHKLELIIQLAAFYGLRRAEVMGLRWEAIDFEAKTLTIRHIVTSTRIDGKKISVEADRAKTKSSLRTLPLVDPIAERLKAVKEQQEYNQKICGNCYNQEYLGYVFVDAMGNLIQPDSVTTGFPQLLKENGLRRIRFHDLRHSCASLLLKEGVPMKQIQEWLGHSDISTTANIYAHLDSQSKNLSARTMANTLTLPEAQPIKKW